MIVLSALTPSRCAVAEALLDRRRRSRCGVLLDLAGRARRHRGLAPSSETELVFGESFRVTLTLTNPTNRDVTLASPMGCLALPSVYRDDERRDWDGTAFF